MSVRRVALGVGCTVVVGLSVGCAGRSVTLPPATIVTPTVTTSSAAPTPTINAGAPRLGPHVLPQVRWRFQTGGRIVADAIELPAGDIVVGSLDGALYRIDANGRLIHRIDTGAPIRSRALALSDETLLIGNGNGVLLRVASDGEILSRTQLSGPIVAGPIEGPDRNVYVAADGIYAFDRADNLLWHHVEPTTIYETPQWNAHGHLVFATVDGRVVTLDTAGAVLSNAVRNPQETPPAATPRTLDAAAIAYSVGPDQVLRATRDDGSELWGYSLGVDVTASVLLAASGTLLIGTDDGILYALH